MNAVVQEEREVETGKRVASRAGEQESEVQRAALQVPVGTLLLPGGQRGRMWGRGGVGRLGVGWGTLACIL